MTKLFLYSNIFLLISSSFLSPVTTVGGISSNLINIREQIINKAKQDEFQEQFKINTTIEEDLQSFNFDYQKYNFSSDQLINPTIINFLPSFNDDYVSLFYIYFPLKLETSFSLTGSITNQNKEAIALENIELGIIDSNDAGYYRLTYKNKLSDEIKEFIDSNDQLNFEINIMSSTNNLKSNTSYFNFDKTLSNDDLSLVKARYNKQTNINETTYYRQDFSSYTTIIELEDPHVWSYRFDTDDWWEQFIESVSNLFGYNSDSLEDQFFYSFSLPLGWSNYEIADISLRWKEMLLTAYADNIISNVDHYNYFETDTTTGEIDSNCDRYNNYLLPHAQYYHLNDEGEIDRFYGYTKEQVRRNDIYTLPYTYSTIEPTNVTTNIGSTKFTWKKIQTANEFKDAFKELEDIIDFASSYMPNDNYYIVNFDEFEYNYSNLVFTYETASDNVDPTGYYQEFIEYLDDSGLEKKTFLETTTSPGTTLPIYITYTGYEIYKFTMNYYMDVEATEMTLVNSDGDVIKATVSVEPKDLENSGGGSTNLNWLDTLFGPIVDWFSDAFNVIKLIFWIIISLIVVSLIGKIISIFKKKEQNK